MPTIFKVFCFILEEKKDSMLVKQFFKVTKTATLEPRLDFPFNCHFHLISYIIGYFLQSMIVNHAAIILMFLGMKLIREMSKAQEPIPHHFPNQIPLCRFYI